jgi:hypothetical protein
VRLGMRRGKLSGDSAGCFEKVTCESRPHVSKATVSWCTLTEPLHKCSGGEHRVSHWHKCVGNLE